MMRLAMLPQARETTFFTAIHRLTVNGLSVPGFRPASGLDHDLERLALVHRPIAVGNTVEIGDFVEHLIHFKARSPSAVDHLLCGLAVTVALDLDLRGHLVQLAQIFLR